MKLETAEFKQSIIQMHQFTNVLNQTMNDMHVALRNATKITFPNETKLAIQRLSDQTRETFLIVSERMKEIINSMSYVRDNLQTFKMPQVEVPKDIIDLYFELSAQVETQNINEGINDLPSSAVVVTKEAKKDVNWITILTLIGIIITIISDGYNLIDKIFISDEKDAVIQEQRETIDQQQNFINIQQKLFDEKKTNETLQKTNQLLESIETYFSDSEEESTVVPLKVENP